MKKGGERRELISLEIGIERERQGRNENKNGSYTLYILSRTGSVLLNRPRVEPTQARYLKPNAQHLVFKPNSFFYLLHTP